MKLSKNGRTLTLCVMFSLLLASVGMFTEGTSTGRLLMSQSTQDDAGAGRDAPDSFQIEMEIDTNTSYTGKVGGDLINEAGEKDNDDYYTFDVPSAGIIRLTFDRTDTGDLDILFTILAILKDNRTVNNVWQNFDFVSDLVLEAKVPSADIYQFHIFTLENSIEYEFEIDFIAVQHIPQDDGGLSADADLDNPAEIDVGTTYNAVIGRGNVDDDGYLDLKDYFKIDLTDEGYLTTTVEVTSGASTSFSTSVDTSENEDIVLRQFVKSSSLTFETPIAGSSTYFIEIRSWEAGFEYNLLLSFSAETLDSQNDAENGEDAGSGFDTSITISENDEVEGSIGQGLLEIDSGAMDRYDFYELPVLEAGVLNFEIRQVSVRTAETGEVPPNGVWLSLIDKKKLFGQLIEDIDIYADGSVYGDSGICVDRSNEYFVRIFSTAPELQYKFTVEYTEGQDEGCPNPETVPFNTVSIMLGFTFAVILTYARKMKLQKIA